MPPKLDGLEPPLLFPSRAPRDTLAYHEINFVGVKPRTKYSINRIENELNAPIFAPGPVLNGANTPLPFFPRAEKLPQLWSQANRVAYQGFVQGINDDRNAMLSANNMLARGNLEAAQLILGRPLTDEEISAKNLFPPVLDPVTNRPVGASTMGQPNVLMVDDLQRDAENTAQSLGKFVDQAIAQATPPPVPQNPSDLSSALASSVTPDQSANASSTTPTLNDEQPGAPPQAPPYLESPPGTPKYPPVTSGVAFHYQPPLPFPQDDDEEESPYSVVPNAPSPPSAGIPGAPPMTFGEADTSSIYPNPQIQSDEWRVPFSADDLKFGMQRLKPTTIVRQKFDEDPMTKLMADIRNRVRETEVVTRDLDEAVRERRSQTLAQAMLQAGPDSEWQQKLKNFNRTGFLDQMKKKEERLRQIALTGKEVVEAAGDSKLNSIDIDSGITDIQRQARNTVTRAELFNYIPGSRNAPMDLTGDQTPTRTTVDLTGSQTPPTIDLTAMDDDVDMENPGVEASSANSGSPDDYDSTMGESPTQNAPSVAMQVEQHRKRALDAQIAREATSLEKRMKQSLDPFQGALDNLNQAAPSTAVQSGSQIAAGNQGLYVQHDPPPGALPPSTAQRPTSMNAAASAQGGVPEVDPNVIPPLESVLHNLEQGGVTNVRQNVQQAVDNIERKAQEDVQNVDYNRMQMPSREEKKQDELKQSEQPERSSALTVSALENALVWIGDAIRIQKELEPIAASMVGMNPGFRLTIQQRKLAGFIRSKKFKDIMTRTRGSQDYRIYDALRAFNAEMKVLITRWQKNKSSFGQIINWDEAHYVFQEIKKTVRMLPETLNHLLTNIPPDPVANLIPNAELEEAKEAEENIQQSSVTDLQQAQQDMSQIGQVVGAQAQPPPAATNNTAWEQPLPPPTHRVTGAPVDQVPLLERPPAQVVETHHLPRPTSERQGPSRGTRSQTGAPVNRKHEHLRGMNKNGRGIEGSGLMTEMPSSKKTLLQMLRIQMGIVDAGNDAPELLKRMSEILMYGVSQGWISPQLMRGILQHYY